MKTPAATKTRTRKAQPKSAQPKARQSKKPVRRKAADRTYLELKQEIANTERLLNEELTALHAEADAARERERAGVIAKINVAIAEFGLRPQDLDFKKVSSRAGKKLGKPAAKKSAAKKSAAKKPSVIKYQDGEGNNWSGRGRQPGWLTAALAAGKQLEDFRTA
ncbi:H-NS histone family protein [Aquabacterium sp.]|uniref:H-NS histone family protein n=1 Tax=Aquabacterium sp. TaxID=1872578 RepID=UPI004037982E